MSSSHTGTCGRSSCDWEAHEFTPPRVSKCFDRRLCAQIVGEKAENSKAPSAELATWHCDEAARAAGVDHAEDSPRVSDPPLA